MTHGSGGRAMAQLIDELFARAFDNEFLRQGNDGAVLAVPAGRLVMATDSHVVSPLFFPGGDIGCLSVHGTINDVAVMGATPLYLAAGFVLEEGFPLAELKRIVDSMAAAAREAGVPVVTGDTKVVEQGKGDGVFITTTGVGVLRAGVDVRGDRARPGDRVLVSGTLGDHGVAIMSLRENLDVRDDDHLGHGRAAWADRGDAGRRAVAARAARPDARRARDDAERDRAPVRLRHPARPRRRSPCVRRWRRRASSSASIPLYVANEGKVVAICAAEDAEAVLAAMRAHPLGAQAAIVGEVTADPHHFVQMDTRFGGRRVVDWLTGEQLPRIC